MDFTNPNLGAEFQGKIIKGMVTEIDKGSVVASVTVQSGKRMFVSVMSLAELVKSGIQERREVYCIINGKDILLVSDIKEYLTRVLKDNPNMETYLVKGQDNRVIL